MHTLSPTDTEDVIMPRFIPLWEPDSKYVIAYLRSLTHRPGIEHWRTVGVRAK